MGFSGEDRRLGNRVGGMGNMAEIHGQVYEIEYVVGYPGFRRGPGCGL